MIIKEQAESWDELEMQVMLYRFSLKRKYADLGNHELREVLRNRVNKKFKEENKRIISGTLNSCTNLLYGLHEC